MRYPARVFQCQPNPPNPRPGQKLPKPVELAERAVEANNPDAAMRSLRAELVRDFGPRSVRSVSCTPARNGAKGKVELVAYIHPEGNDR